jgi:regulatory protein YycH of two-component signal transduction system YycFG
MSKTFATGEEAARALSDFVNHAGDVEKKEFVKIFTCYTHRTLQQQGMDLFLRLVEAWAEKYDQGVYDGRNEFTCREAKNIKEHTDCLRMPLI